MNKEGNLHFVIYRDPQLQSDESFRAPKCEQTGKDVGNGIKASSRRRHHEFKSSNDTEAETQLIDSSPRGHGSRSVESPDVTASIDTSECVDSTSRQLRTQNGGLASAKTHPGETPLLPTYNLVSKYESARAKFRLDVTDLAMLASFRECVDVQYARAESHIGKDTIPPIVTDTAKLVSLLGDRRGSYLDFIPSRYGLSECITAATDCVLGRMRAVLGVGDSNSEETILHLHAKALQTLQESISHSSNCLEADVLCSTALLGIHEVLCPSSESAFDNHITGSEHLVRNRTPKRFQTEFDKALFASHVGPVVSQALCQNKPCYLEQPEWLALYRSLTVESDFLQERSPLAVALQAATFVLPGLWFSVEETVQGPGLFDDVALTDLRRRGLALEKELVGWTEDYKAHCVRLSLVQPPLQEIALRRELFGIAITSLIIVKRLLSTVYEHDRQRLETEAQALVRVVLDLQSSPSPKHSWLFSGREVGVAYGTLLTREEWERSWADESVYDRKMAARTRYSVWSNMLRGIILSPSYLQESIQYLAQQKSITDLSNSPLSIDT